MQFSKRLQPLKTNVFADMDRAKGRALRLGQEILDLSLGSSDLPTPPHVIEAIQLALVDPSTHGYLLFNGTQLFREAVAKWYTNKYGINVDPETEVLPLIGSQEGTAHLPLAILEPGIWREVKFTRCPYSPRMDSCLCWVIFRLQPWRKLE
jgi:aspartate/methionine/tyrosine aminotransferase